MKSRISKLYELNHFFRILESNEYKISSSLKLPGRLLLENIYKSWLQFNLAKTQKHMIVYTNKSFSNTKNKIPYGYLVQDVNTFDNEIIINHELLEMAPKTKTDLQIHLILPEQDKMQYFMQWQRYRKFWWSSITTTPSLFTIDDIQQDSQVANVNINAQFDWGTHAVESVKMEHQNSTAHLTCSLHLENALITILLDSLNNSMGCLRIHRKMAPYKLSYAIDCKEVKNHHELSELAALMHYKLLARRIPNHLPKFKCSFEEQIKENLLMGTNYTVILTESTLSNGFFYLFNSNTTLKEQVHIADFDLYAARLFKK